MQSVLAFVCFLMAMLHASSALSRLAVLTSFAPIRSLVLNVTGDAAEVSVLIPPTTGSSRLLVFSRSGKTRVKAHGKLEEIGAGHLIDRQIGKLSG